MAFRKPSRTVLRSLCGRVDEGDGVDPRLEARSLRGQAESSGGKQGRKVRQLCRQVWEAIELSPGGDEVLSGLTVVSVEPAPDASRLLVTVAPRPGEPFDPDAMVAALERASPRLRSEVASAITRRRAPSLAFRVAIPDLPQD